MPRPRKYATTAEFQENRKAQDRLRKRAERAPAHAAKADPTKRKDAFVNAKAYPAAPVNDDVLAMIDRIVSQAGELGSTGVPIMSANRDAAALMLEEWEERNRLRLPALPDNGARTRGKTGIEALTPAAQWNRLAFPLRYTLAMILPRNGRRLRNAELEQADADAAGLSVTALRDQRHGAAVRKRRTQESRLAHEEAANEQLELAAREDEARMSALAEFGRF
jgi:hypothetical protein